MRRAVPLILVLATALPGAAAAQDVGSGRPVIDTIVVVTHNVFDPAEAGSNFLFRLANGLRFTTRTAVVHRELLFQAGEPYDSALVAETLRNLRALGLFRDVSIDTVRIGSRLAARVETFDGWTTELQLNARSTGGTFSWSVGLVERNFLGRATRAGASYRDEPDRTALTFVLGNDRAFGSAVAFQALYDDLSDGKRGLWSVGVPFRSFTDRSAVQFSGAAGSERVLQYRDGVARDTLWRRLLVQRATAAVAARATSAAYVRLGVTGQVRRTEYLQLADTGLTLPDSVTGAIGLVGEFRLAHFKVVTHYNGFDREIDLDLSTGATITGLLASEAFGYARTGVGVAFAGQSGVSVGRNFALLQLNANGLFNSAGLDSGRVWVGLTLSSQAIPRAATVLHVEAGSRTGIPPGSEFDLGHGLGPRAFGPHAFTGERSVWGSIEQRAFLVDEVLGLLGIGVTAFVDYGGAWFRDQPRRLGGDVGAGLRLGATRATGANVGRIDLAYRFGEGFGDNRWVVVFGRGFEF